MANRWWVYQKARFPVFKHGLQVAVLSISAVGYSRVLREGLPLQSLAGIPRLSLLAFIALFLLVWQRHVVEELKAGSNIQTKPNRPPRGWVSRRELMILAIAAGLIQLGLVLAIGLPMLGLLLLVWGYLWLSHRDFRVSGWLKDHPRVEVWARTLFLPLLTFYASAHDWLTAGATVPMGLVWLLLSGWIGGLTLELGQQIGASTIEEPCKITVPDLEERQQAVSVWLIAIWLLTVTTLLAAQHISFVTLVALIVLLLLTGSLLIVWQFLAHPGKRTRQRLDQMSQLWMLISHLSIGILPLWLR